jgi:hypothetical protein
VVPNTRRCAASQRAKLNAASPPRKVSKALNDSAAPRPTMSACP